MSSSLLLDFTMHMPHGPLSEFHWSFQALQNCPLQWELHLLVPVNELFCTCYHLPNKYFTFILPREASQEPFPVLTYLSQRNIISSKHFDVTFKIVWPLLPDFIAQTYLLTFFFMLTITSSFSLDVSAAKLCFLLGKNFTILTTFYNALNVHTYLVSVSLIEGFLPLLDVKTLKKGGGLLWIAMVTTSNSNYW